MHLRDLHTLLSVPRLIGFTLLPALRKDLDPCVRVLALWTLKKLFDLEPMFNFFWYSYGF